VDELAVSVDTLLAYIGSEYVHRRRLEEQVHKLQATIAQMAEQMRSPATEPDRDTRQG